MYERLPAAYFATQLRIPAPAEAASQPTGGQLRETCGHQSHGRVVPTVHTAAMQAPPDATKTTIDLEHTEFSGEYCLPGSLQQQWSQSQGSGG
ncbi:hypothetical protein WJX84_005668 [Apatococcus fuscideae]|uniref:Uncharacterized protein n=1 Tax=Apatococcus fuscideae TaxID=2026836 RepID=A0AAW1TG27_9CHLO